MWFVLFLLVFVLVVLSVVYVVELLWLGFEWMLVVVMGGKLLFFFEGVCVGDMFYLLGQIGMVFDGMLFVGMVVQVKNVFDWIIVLLVKQGFGWKDMVCCLVMFKDMVDWLVFNMIYVGYVDFVYLLVCSVFGVMGLVLGVFVEVQCDVYMLVKQLGCIDVVVFVDLCDLVGCDELDCEQCQFGYCCEDVDEQWLLGGEGECDDQVGCCCCEYQVCLDIVEVDYQVVDLCQSFG